SAGHWTGRGGRGARWQTSLGICPSREGGAFPRTRRGFATARLQVLVLLALVEPPFVAQLGRLPRGVDLQHAATAGLDFPPRRQGVVRVLLDQTLKPSGKPRRRGGGAFPPLDLAVVAVAVVRDVDRLNGQPLEQAADGLQLLGLLFLQGRQLLFFALATGHR